MATIQKRTDNAGSISYRVQVRLKGYPKQTATFSRLTDAKHWAQNTESAIRERRYFKSKDAMKYTMGQLIDRYIETVLPRKPGSIKKQTMQLQWWKKHIGEYTVADVTPALIAEQRDKLLGKETVRKTNRSPATVNRYMAALSIVFSTAMKEWGIVEHSPVPRVTRYKEDNKRVRFLTKEEISRLLDACKASELCYLHALVILAISTAARRMEILGLKWSEVDLEKGTLRLERTKNKERRTIPVRGPALKALKDLYSTRRLGTDLVFPGGNPQNPVEIWKPWQKALKVAKITDFRWHDLRHTSLSHLAMNGATTSELAEVAGHKTLAMVKRYTHFAEGHTANILDDLTKKLFS